MRYKNLNFNENTGAYLRTTENINGYYDRLYFKDKKILSVVGSGDQIFEAILRGAKEIDGFDISHNAILLYYLKEADYNDQYYTGRQELSNQDFLALVLDYDKEKSIATITERNYFKVGDEVEIFTPTGETYSFTVEKLYDEQMNPIDVARHPEEVLKLYVPYPVVKDSMMRIKIK